jgi:hypothetical protein
MSFDDLCAEGTSEYEAHVLEKREEEIRYLSYVVELEAARLEREALLEDLKEHEAMLRIEKGA